jgi:hypothetical protein
MIEGWGWGAILFMNGIFIIVGLFRKSNFDKNDTVEQAGVKFAVILLFVYASINVYGAVKLFGWL